MDFPIICRACGAAGEVSSSVLSQIDTEHTLTCASCGSDDLDVAETAHVAADDQSKGVKIKLSLGTDPATGRDATRYEVVDASDRVVFTTFDYDEASKKLGAKSAAAGTMGLDSGPWGLDFQKVTEALQSGGWIITLDDGSQVLAPNTPPDLAHMYQSLSQMGYANGFMASRRVHAGENERLIEQMKEQDRAKYRPGPDDDCSNCEHTYEEHGGEYGCDACVEDGNVPACGRFQPAHQAARKSVKAFKVADVVSDPAATTPPAVYDQRLRCSTCFNEWTAPIAAPGQPVGPCPACGADTVTPAGATGVAASKKRTEIVAGILATNPGMNAVAAIALAEETMSRFPGVIADTKTASGTAEVIAVSGDARSVFEVPFVNDDIQGYTDGWKDNLYEDIQEWLDSFMREGAPVNLNGSTKHQVVISVSYRGQTKQVTKAGNGWNVGQLMGPADDYNLTYDIEEALLDITGLKYVGSRKTAENGPQPGEMVSLDSEGHADNGQVGRLQRVEGDTAWVMVFGVGQKRWPYSKVKFAWGLVTGVPQS